MIRKYSFIFMLLFCFSQPVFSQDPAKVRKQLARLMQDYLSGFSKVDYVLDGARFGNIALVGKGTAYVFTLALGQDQEQAQALFGKWRAILEGATLNNAKLTGVSCSKESENPYCRIWKLDEAGLRRNPAYAGFRFQLQLVDMSKMNTGFSLALYAGDITD